jgi:hypothetical protein
MADSDHEFDHTAQGSTDWVDYFYDLYESLHQFRDQNCLLVLDQDNFQDFLELCMDNMNQEVVNSEISADAQMDVRNNRVGSANIGELSE